MQNAPEEFIKRWFDIATLCLQQEDQALRQSLLPHSNNAYRNWSAGLLCIYEVNIVYLILRQCWRLGFPCVFGWEVPYHKAPRERLDLAIYEKSPDAFLGNETIDYAIEVKIWPIGSIDETRKRNEIIGDFRKLIKPGNICTNHRCELLLSFGESESEIRDKVHDLIKEAGLKDFTISEICSSVIGSHIAYKNTLGYLRMSLLELT